MHTMRSDAAESFLAYGEADGQILMQRRPGQGDILQQFQRRASGVADQGEEIGKAVFAQRGRLGPGAALPEEVAEGLGDEERLFICLKRAGVRRGSGDGGARRGILSCSRIQF